MTDVGLILDADALLSYTSGSDIGTLIAEASDLRLSVVVPATSLAAAYRDADGSVFGHLDVLATLPHVVIAPLNQELCLFVGGWGRKLGLELAHAAIEAASHPDAAFVTGRRELVTEFLPKEWPIIDL